MPSFTKKAIVESFLRLSAKRPLEKITVRDIVDDCGINRNTFYYYFQDIYAVLEEVFRFGFSDLPQGAPLAESLAALFTAQADFAARCPRAVRNLIIAVGTDGLHRYLQEELTPLILSCLARDTGRDRRDALLREAAACVRASYVWALADYLRDQKAPPPEAHTAHFAALCAGLESALRAEKPDTN